MAASFLYFRKYCCTMQFSPTQHIHSMVSPDSMDEQYSRFFINLALPMPDLPVR